MALFRRSSTEAAPTPSAPAPSPTSPGGRKSGPTPTRKEAEAARRQRVTQTYSKKEAKTMASRQSRADRMKALAVRDSTPEKQLMRDYVDARFSVGEVLLPSLVLVLALSFLNKVLPQAAVVGTVIMYLYILAVLADLFFLWRGFKRVLAARLPRSSNKGLLMYGSNRAIQIRRFRVPAPRVKRGEKF